MYKVYPCQRHKNLTPAGSPFYRQGVTVIIAQQCPHCVVIEDSTSGEVEEGKGLITQFEDAVVLVEEVIEPKTWARWAIFGFARWVRTKISK